MSILEKLNSNIIGIDFVLKSAIEHIGVEKVEVVIDVLVMAIIERSNVGELGVKCTLSHDDYDPKAIKIAKTLLIRKGYKVKTHTRTIGGLYSTRNDFVTDVIIDWAE